MGNQRAVKTSLERAHQLVFSSEILAYLCGTVLGWMKWETNLAAERRETGYTAYCTIDSNMLPCPLGKIKRSVVAELKGGRFFVFSVIFWNRMRWSLLQYVYYSPGQTLSPRVSLLLLSDGRKTIQGMT